MNKEDKLSTAVLNLNEVREEDKKGKQARRKKIPFILMILGILLVMIGLIILLLKGIKKEENKTSVVESNQLTCYRTSNENGLNYRDEVIYSFNNDNYLQSANLNLITTVSENVDSTVVAGINDEYSKLITKEINGVKIESNTSDNKEITLVINVDYENYTTGLEAESKLNNDLIVNVTKENIKEEINELVKSQGGLCE